MDTVRRYVRSALFVLGIMLMVLTIAGLLKKLYDMSGIKEVFRYRSRHESEDDRSIEGGSARRLLYRETDESDADEPSSITHRMLPRLAVRRQHSNSDGEGGPEKATRGLAETRSSEEFGRRIRTLSESGLPPALNAQIGRTEDGTTLNPVLLGRLGSQHKNVKKLALASLEKTISASSSQDDTLPTRQISEPIPGADEENAFHITSSASASMPEIPDAMFDSDEGRPAGSKNGISGQRLLLFRLFLIAFLLLVGILFVSAHACLETWLGGPWCVLILSVSQSIQDALVSSGLLSVIAQGLDTVKDLLQAKVSRLSGIPKPRANVGNGHQGSSSSLSVAALGVAFVLILSLSVLCRRRPMKRSSSNQQSGNTIPPSKRPSPTYANRPFKSHLSSPTQLHKNADALASFVSRLEKAGYQISRGDPDGVELPNENLVHNLMSQSVVFVVFVTNDAFGRVRCMEEVKWALDELKDTPILVLNTPGVCWDTLPLDFLQLLEHARIKKLEIEPEIWNDDNLQPAGLCAAIEEARNRRTIRPIFDVYISHFRVYKSEAQLKILMTHKTQPTALSSLTLIVALLNDEDSIHHTLGLITAMTRAGTLGLTDAHVLVALLQSKLVDSIEQRSNIDGLEAQYRTPELS